MSATPISFCEALDPEARAKRLAAFSFLSGGTMRLKDEFMGRPFRPGFCTICGGKLPTTWRAVKWDEGTNTFKWVESDHSEESLANVEKFRAVPVDEFGLRKGYLLQPVSICDVMTVESVWKRARAILAEHASKVRQQMEMKERAESEREKRAVKAMARNESF